MSLRSRSVAPTTRGSGDVAEISFGKLSINQPTRAIGVNGGKGTDADDMAVDGGGSNSSDGGGGGGGDYLMPQTLAGDPDVRARMASIVNGLATVTKELPKPPHADTLLQRAMKHDLWSILPPSGNRIENQLARWKSKFKSAYGKMLKHEAVKERYQMPMELGKARKNMVPAPDSAYRWATALSCATVGDCADLKGTERTSVDEPPPSSPEHASIVARKEETVKKGREFFENSINVYSVAMAELVEHSNGAVSLSSNSETMQDKRDAYLSHADNMYLTSRIENTVLRDRDTIVQSLESVLKGYRAALEEGDVDDADPEIESEIRELVMRHALLQFYMLGSVLPPLSEEIEGQTMERARLYKGSDWIAALLAVEDLYTHGHASDAKDPRVENRTFLEETILTMRPHIDETVTPRKPKSALGSEVCAIYIEAMIELLKVPEDVAQENVRVPPTPTKAWTSEVFRELQPIGNDDGITLLGRRTLHLGCMEDFVAAIQHRWPRHPRDATMAAEWESDKVKPEHGWFGTSAMSMYALGCLLERVLHKNPKVAAAIEAANSSAPTPDPTQLSDDGHVVLTALEAGGADPTLAANASKSAMAVLTDWTTRGEEADVPLPAQGSPSRSAPPTRASEAAVRERGAARMANRLASQNPDAPSEPLPAGVDGRGSTHGFAASSLADALRTESCAHALHSVELHRLMESYGENVTTLQGKLDALQAAVDAVKDADAQKSAAQRGTNKGIGALVAQVAQLTSQVKTVTVQLNANAQAAQRPADARVEAEQRLAGGGSGGRSADIARLSEKSQEAVRKAEALSVIAFNRFKNSKEFMEALKKKKEGVEAGAKAAKEAEAKAAKEKGAETAKEAAAAAKEAAKAAKEAAAAAKAAKEAVGKAAKEAAKEAAEAAKGLMDEVQKDLVNIGTFLAEATSFVRSGPKDEVSERITTRAQAALVEKLASAEALAFEFDHHYVLGDAQPGKWLEQLTDVKRRSSENATSAQQQYREAADVAEDLTYSRDDGPTQRQVKQERLEARARIRTQELTLIEQERDQAADKWLKDALDDLRQYPERTRTVFTRLRDAAKNATMRGIRRNVVAAVQYGGFWGALSKMPKKAFEVMHGFMTWESAKVFVIATGTLNATCSYWGMVLAVGAWLMGAERLDHMQRAGPRALSNYVEARPKLAYALKLLDTIGSTLVNVASQGITKMVEWSGHTDRALRVNNICMSLLGRGVIRTSAGFAGLFLTQVVGNLASQNISTTLWSALEVLVLVPLKYMFQTPIAFAWGPVGAVWGAVDAALRAAGLLQSGVVWTVAAVRAVFAQVAASFGIPVFYLMLAFLTALSLGGYYIAIGRRPGPPKRKGPEDGNEEDKDVKTARILESMSRGVPGAAVTRASLARYKAVRFPSDRPSSDSAPRGSGAWHRKEFFMLAAVGTGASALLLADA